MLFKEPVWFTSLGPLVGGAAGVVSRITGSVGKGLAAITMDKEYQQKRREEMGRQPKDFGDSLARGGKGLLLVSLLLNLQEILPYRHTLAYVLVVWHLEHCLWVKVSEWQQWKIAHLLFPSLFFFPFITISLPLPPSVPRLWCLGWSESCNDGRLALVWKVGKWSRGVWR